MKYSAYKEKKFLANLFLKEDILELAFDAYSHFALTKFMKAEIPK